MFSGERPLVGAAEQEQCFGEVDRSGVDGVEAVDELAGVAVRIVAGHVEKCLRDRQRGAQFVGGVGCESLLLGDVCFEPREHGVEGVGEFAELVPDGPPARIRWESDPLAAMRVASVMRVRGASMRPARSHPPSRPNTSRNAITMAAVGAKSRRRSAWLRTTEDHTRVHTTRKGEVPGGEQHGTCEHEEAGVAEGEFEANAQTRGPIHGLLPHARCLVACRCGSRRRPRWR